MHKTEVNWCLVNEGPGGEAARGGAGHEGGLVLVEAVPRAAVHRPAHRRGGS